MRRPRWLVALPVRVRTLLLPGRAERDLEDELAFHLERQAEAHRRSGRADVDARLLARRQFGGVEQSRERCRDQRPLRWLDELARDVQYALRTFRRSPRFVAAAVLVLALGISANTTVFSLVNGMLFRPLPVPAPGELRYVHTRWERNRILQKVPYAAFRHLAEHNEAFAGLAQCDLDFAKIGSGLQPMRVVGERVSTNYFEVLRVRPALGRAFLPSDDVPGVDPVLIVSDRFWRRVLQADPNAIGTRIELRMSTPGYYSEHRGGYTVVGVMPRGFNGIANWIGPADFWATIRQRAIEHHDAMVADLGEGGAWRVEDAMGGVVVGRLRPGATDSQALQAVVAADRVLRAGDEDDPSMRRQRRTLVYDSRTAAGRRVPFAGAGETVPERLALALAAVSTLVLLIAAANLVGILMARGVSRRKEIATRLALGGGRARVARQVLTESLLLSLAGSVAAVGLARLLIGLFVAVVPAQLTAWSNPLLADPPAVAIDLPALLLTAVLGLTAGILVALVPARQALETAVLPALSSGAAPAATPRHRSRHWIVAPQIALSLVLLLVAGVLVQSLIRAELGYRAFEPEKVVRANYQVKRTPATFSGPGERQAEGERRQNIGQRLLETLRATPAVEHAALGISLLDSVSVVARSGDRAGQHRWVESIVGSSGYFETMGIPILQGRGFDGRDTEATAPVAVICERLAEQLWPGSDAVGQYLAEYDSKAEKPAAMWLLVVGVAMQVKRPGEEFRTNPSLYRPIEQSGHWPSVVRVRGRAAGPETKQELLSAIEVAGVDVEVTFMSTMLEDIDNVLYPRRLGTAILALSGFLGLLLSSVGLYGVVSYSAAERAREIGIRAAFGADRRAIVRLMLGETLRVLAIGLPAGVALGIAAMRASASVVVGLPSLDATTLVVVPVLLSGVILAAGLAPARRAARANPIDVLRAP